MNFTLPLCSTNGYFFDDDGNISKRPNSLVKQNKSFHPDEQAIFSVLQFGAIIPPLSPWQEVKRLVPGYQYSNTNQVCVVERGEGLNLGCLTLDQQANYIENLIDSALLSNLKDRGDPILLFSGGVDSGFLASRLAALGCWDSLLINYSFGENDSESHLAEEMAKHLGLKYKRILADSEQAFDTCLEYPGQVYPQPFGDRSTVATSALANAVTKYFPERERLIIDGTGADGAFGMTQKIKVWTQIFKIPGFLRYVASLPYPTALWHRNGKIEYLGRILKRSASMPHLSAVIAQNPLAGFLYHDELKEAVYQLLEDWISTWVGKLLPQQIVAGDMALTCANIFAQKAQAIFDMADRQVYYPFLQSATVATALATVENLDELNHLQQPKALLKHSLSRHVPGYMVYRPKSSFTDTKNKDFYQDKFIDLLRSSVESGSSIKATVREKEIIKACDLLKSGVKLPEQTLNCLWSVVFLDRWYNTAR